ncbi:class I glutamine amidotransferase-like protein [Tilletiaria anomala UBC 951]|uniref:Class I glutamine amidotransferase-like protein n=1 Tax=Tilletiaria anomala (strain ATCC 24038 / CBS 436.72 / UBC 951) TaxID=1037660 RepID=A0A066WG39_TILAU|nr:class I glutamine amidotransferase-like protein [Tilletiaria anomala UBC 951]KDN52922.1 class I glutamine amidotransferase-like protein [Tilletiaria anomala UBC 951]
MASGSKKNISIALLVADTPPEPVVAAYGDYEKIYKNFLQQSANTVKRHRWQESLDLRIRPFDVVHKQEYPDEGQLSDGLWDAIMITGSASSAHADVPWSNKLVQFVAKIAEEHPLVRIIGICYGHQIVGRAFGAEVKLNPRGWEVGVYDAQMTEEGKELLNWEPEESSCLRLQQVHRDEVIELPPDFNGEEFINLASTARTPIQGIALRYPTECPPIPSVVNTSAYLAFDISDSGISSSGPLPARSLHVLTTQGHPEFNREIVELIMSVKTEMGAITGNLLEEGLQNAQKEHDGLRMGAIFLAMLGYERAKDEGGHSF